jgi:hypothetical protein
MGNLQVRFLEGWAPAMAPGHSTIPGVAFIDPQMRFVLPESRQTRRISHAFPSSNATVIANKVILSPMCSRLFSSQDTKSGLHS